MFSSNVNTKGTTRTVMAPVESLKRIPSTYSETAPKNSAKHLRVVKIIDWDQRLTAFMDREQRTRFGFSGASLLGVPKEAICTI